jgi:hypothetical protein
MAYLPITVAARSKTRNVLARSNAGIESHSRHGCLCVCVCVLGSGLVKGWSPIQGVLPTVLDYESEVKRNDSRMPYAPSGSNRNRGRKGRNMVYFPLLFNIELRRLVPPPAGANGNTFLRNGGEYLPDYDAMHYRIQYLSPFIGPHIDNLLSYIIFFNIKSVTNS